MITWIGLGVAILGLLIVMWMLLTRRLREKYAIIWILVAIVMILLGAFPAILTSLTHALGVELPANLIFALAIGLLLVVALHLSWELSQLEEETRRSAEEIAILRADVDALGRRLAVQEHEGEGSGFRGDDEADG
ncbi:MULTISPECIES: DUF2304 domain-containing protein [unclassified Microbacterium]|uniref:DUF2304 domain-containing protein n=1 Tax=unclassified Microbacterium TaxID=2609290 RepID=UPI0012FBB553|nr:DUF2304 domain-containing protein [Microbacterium sp. MAH-37]MVQ41829.1 DUF2304 family protein [Microbacterium sp. MAH-37]